MDEGSRAYQTKRPLSSSSEQAMRYAMLRATEREADRFSSVDLLVGIFFTHPKDAEPLHLIEAGGVSPEGFLAELATDGGFIPGGKHRGDWKDARAIAPLEEVEQLLASADKLALEYNPESDHYIRLRDLFGGLLLTDNAASSLIAKALAPTALSFEAVRDSYTDFVRLHSSGTSYADFLNEHHPAVHPLFSGYDSDTPSEEDLVGIGPEVNAMAYLITARTLIPPLAIGLFGDWGSGKSFFMQALKRRIHKITADARDAGTPQRDIDVFKYVVQIEFNAWHYVEGELWASLVEHILRNLQLGTDDSETELQRRKQHWIERLRQARQEEKDITELKNSLESELQQTRERIRGAEEDLEKTRRQLQRLTLEDVWQAVELTEAEKQEIRQTAEAVGLSSAGDSAADLMTALQETGSVLRRGNALLAPLQFSGWRGAVWVGALLVVMFAGPAVTLLLSKLTTLPPLTEAFTTLGGFLTTLAGAVAAGNAWIRKWLTRAEADKGRLDARRAAAETKIVQEVARLRTQQLEQNDELRAAREQGEKKRREIRELEQELDGLTPGRVLLDFINERVGSEDYRKHLGVAALIRRDFDKLSGLITAGNAEFEEKDTGKRTAEDEHRINRIVLYIDDLDRCPPERVVEVLQAVHLLLAFPLFVVVVAVDARWLAQSLRGHYERLLAADGRDVATTTRQATPHDYLEKIFQIPFWIRPLPPRARARIVQGLVAKSLVADEKPGGGKEGRTGGVTPTTPADHVRWHNEDPERPLKRDEKTEFRPHGLEIREEELAFMENLKPILGVSPRAVKRFVNVYRLVKASAMTASKDFLSDRPDADYRVVLFLLAVVTGLPTISRRFFAAVVASTDALSDTRTIADVTNGLGTEPIGGAADERREKADLERLRHWVTTYDESGWKDMEVGRLAVWMPRVARFSYRIEV